MLDFQMKQTPFRYGLAEGDDPHAVPFGVLTTLENYVWKKANRVEKRNGNDFQGYGIVGGSTLTAAKRLFTRNFDKELCLFDGSTLYSYSAGVAAWTPVAALPDVGVTQTPLIDPFLGIQAADTNTSGNFVVTAFLNGDPTSEVAKGVSVCVTDLSTGSLLMPVTVVTSLAIAYAVRVIIIGTTAIIIAAGAPDATIRAWSLDLTTYAVTGPTVLRADRNNAQFQNWDARLLTGSAFFVLAYNTTAAGVRTTIYDATFAVQASALDAASIPTPSKLAVDCRAGEYIAIAGFPNAGGLKVQICDPTTAVTTAVTAGTLDPTFTVVQQVGICRYDATQCAVVWTTQPNVGATAVSQTHSIIVDLTGAAVANTHRITSGPALISNPFVVNGKCYVFANTAGGFAGGAMPSTFLGNSSILLGVFPGPDDGTSAATNLTHPLVGCPDTLLGAFSGFRACLPVFCPVTATRSVGSIPFIGTAPNAALTWRCALRLIDITAATEVPSDLWRTVSRGAETFISGGVLSVYDGGDAFDYGFNYAPSIHTLTTAAAGGSIAAGNYIYATHGEYRGASGLVYRGPTSVSSTILTAGAVSTNTLRFVNVNVGNKKHLQVERFSSSLPIFRTVVNGTIPQRLTEEPTFNLSPINYALTNQLYTDTRSDAAIDTSGLPPTLASRPAIYTSGGTLDDQQPPSNITMFTHVDRLFVLAGDRKTWWYSKSFNDDIGVAPGFNVSFRILLPNEQVGGISMDDKAIFFSKTGVSYMLGTGPAKDGTASDFTTPVRIQTDVGCTNARSIVSMPDGIMFQSLRGIYILTRNLELLWIGRPVQDTLAAFPNITSAVLVPNRNEIRFTANSADGATGRVLVYNYIEKQWSTSKYFDRVLTGILGVAIADACMWNGAWTFVTNAGIVYKESDVHFFDGSDTYVNGVIETAWNSAAGPIAYHAVRNFWIQGISNSDHDLTIEIAFDSNNTYQQSKVFPSLSPVTAVGDIEEAKISVGTRRKCNSIRFRVTDSAPSTPGSTIGSFAIQNSGKGPTFQTMGYEVGVKKGDNMGQGKKG